MPLIYLYIKNKYKSIQQLGDGWAVALSMNCWLDFKTVVVPDAFSTIFSFRYFKMGKILDSAFILFLLIYACPVCFYIPRLYLNLIKFWLFYKYPSLT